MANGGVGGLQPVSPQPKKDTVFGKEIQFEKLKFQELKGGNVWVESGKVKDLPDVAPSFFSRLISNIGQDANLKMSPAPVMIYCSNVSTRKVGDATIATCQIEITSVNMNGQNVVAEAKRLAQGLKDFQCTQADYSVTSSRVVLTITGPCSKPALSEDITQATNTFKKFPNK